MIRGILTAASVTWAGLMPAQVPLQPVWSVPLPSAWTAPLLAWDPELQRLLAIHATTDHEVFPFEALTADGLPHANTVPPEHIAFFGDLLYDQRMLVRLISHNDSVVLIYRSDVPFGGQFSSVRMLDVGGGSRRMKRSQSRVYDAHWDQLGHVVLEESSLRTYTPKLWPRDTILSTVPDWARMTVSSDRVFVLRPPDIRVYERDPLSWLSDLPIPSSGTVVGERLERVGGQLYYAVLKSGGELDMGSVDTLGTVQWSRSMTAGAGWSLTGLAVDQNGSAWVSLAGATGRLEGTDSTGTITFSGSWPHPLEDVVSSGDRLFLTGREADPGPGFVFCWSPDFTAFVPRTERPELHLAPNPAQHELRVSGLTPGSTELEVVDVAGRRCLPVMRATAATHRVDVGQLAWGHYVLRVTDAHGSRVRAFQVR